MGVRSLRIAPANMQAHALGRNIGDGEIERGNVRLHYFLEAFQGDILEEHGALHRQIRAIELQNKTPSVNEFVFLLHLLDYGKHIALVGIVVSIAHGGGDDARGGRGHEAFGKLLRLLRHTLHEALALLGGVAEVGVSYLIESLWRVLNFSRLAAPRPQDGGVRPAEPNAQRGN